MKPFIVFLGLILLPLRAFGAPAAANVPAKANVNVAYVWSDKPLAGTDQTIRFSAFVENTGGAEARNVAIQCRATEGRIGIEDAQRRIDVLAAGSFQRVDWNLKPRTPGPVRIEVTADSISLPRSAGGQGAKTPAKDYRVLVDDPRANHTRQELCTDDRGYWRLLEKPATLQEQNPAPLAPIRHKTSAEIGHNTYGVSVHLPRAKDYEDPFNPLHLIDGDPETCWSSQTRPSCYPGCPPWVEIDLGRSAAIGQVNLVPYWQNTDFPLGFSILLSEDGQRWRPVLQVTQHSFDRAGPKRGDKIAQCFPLVPHRRARHVRIEFQRLPLSCENYAAVSIGYKARLSGVEVIDDRGENLALAARGASIKASEYFTAWEDTPQSIQRAFPKVMEIGLKWVRVGQWGDQTEWAAVEREKGKFAMDPVTEKAIDTLLDNKVDILWNLDYGNSLYERPDRPGGGDIGPYYHEGHPFSFNAGPRTEAGRQAFVRYVDYVVGKYRGRVHWWELWNEENGWYPGFEPELYGKLLNAVARHIKSVDPQARLMVGGTAAPAPLTTEIALREGAAPFVDACAFHPYGIDKPEGGMGTMEWYRGKDLSQSRQQTGWNRLEEVVAGVQKPYALHGRKDIPVWLNEWGMNVTGLDYNYDPHVGEYSYAKYITRFYVYSGWLGHPAALWALHTLTTCQDWSMIDPKTFGLRPLSYAMQNVCSVVSDVQSLPAPAHHFDGTAPDLKVIAYRRDNSDERLVLVWSAQLNTEKVVSCPGRFSFAAPSRPEKVFLTDLYWGLQQPARWSYENGRVVLDGLIVRDYPVVIQLR